MEKEFDLNEGIKIEYQHRKEEINNLNARNLQFMGFSIGIVGVLTTLGIVHDNPVPFVISNICLLWVLVYILNNRQFILINATYAKYYLEKQSSLKWETRLSKFRSAEFESFTKYTKRHNVHLLETIFFVLFSLMETLLVANTLFQKNDAKNSIFIIFTSLIISGITSVILIYHACKGYYSSKRERVSDECIKKWERID